MAKKSPRRRRVAVRHSVARSSGSTRAATRRRSVVAKKGWATRRAIVAKRSAAAKKGWATRRAIVAKKKKTGRTIAGKTMARAERAREKIHGPTARAEFSVSASYRRKHGKSLDVQFALRGPREATRQDALTAIQEAVTTGAAPRGWTVRAISWRGNDETTDHVQKHINAMHSPLSHSSTSFH